MLTAFPISALRNAWLVCECKWRHLIHSDSPQLTTHTSLYCMLVPLCPPRRAIVILPQSLCSCLSLHLGTDFPSPSLCLSRPLPILLTQCHILQFLPDSSPPALLSLHTSVYNIYWVGQKVCSVFPVR